MKMPTNFSICFQFVRRIFTRLASPFTYARHCDGHIHVNELPNGLARNNSQHLENVTEITTTITTTTTTTTTNNNNNNNNNINDPIATISKGDVLVHYQSFSEL